METRFIDFDTLHTHTNTHMEDVFKLIFLYVNFEDKKNFILHASHDPLLIVICSQF